jgi:chemotaxis protein histidine kinase CheA
MKRLLVASCLLLTACGNANEVDYTWMFECMDSPAAQENPGVCETQHDYEKAVQDYNAKLEKEKEKQEREHAEQVKKDKEEQYKFTQTNAIKQELEKGNYAKAIKMIAVTFDTYDELVEVLGETEHHSGSMTSRSATWKWWENFSQTNAVCYSVKISENDRANKRYGEITISAEIHRFNVENGRQVIAEYSRVGHDWNIVE